MEFKTSQGGTTTLVFDDSEEAIIGGISRGFGMFRDDVVQTLHRMKQAKPLDSFDELVKAAFPGTGGVVPAELKTKKKLLTKADPLATLEQDIRRKLMSASTGSLGSTSQSQQAEAMLLNALATCLLAQTMRDINAG